MFPRTNKRKGISTVLTTMIILVASVVLGTGVVIYGTSLFQTGAQQEAIATQGVALWVETDESIAWGAAGVRNTGDKLVSVDAIQVRGTTVPFTNWYVDANQVRVSTDNFQSQFNHTGTLDTGTYTDGLMLNDTSVTPTTACSAVYSGGYIQQDFDDAGTKSAICLKKSTGPQALNPGERMIVYFRVPDGVFSPVDSGSATSVSIFAGKTGAPTSVTVGNP
ncbi:MAG: hypothetical protein WEB28_06575 [Nitrosopumilaceae archaeon]